MTAHAVAETTAPHRSVTGSMQRGSSFAALLTTLLTGWCECPNQDHRGERSREVYIGPLVTTHDVFREALLESDYGPDTHYLLGRKHGGFPLRLGSRPAVEALLAELKKDWRRYRRAIIGCKPVLEPMSTAVSK